ncbi:GtrA family protein [Duganella callida]|uniref:GtrA family protein n=1 Tax=Duganella callida TaxID=2561932 RepID=A0A4Y9SL27_9BURK|nr:GtrA family protein [Duganella callida]TFW24328.1 GtrA family protein [Duganella callida]
MPAANNLSGRSLFSFLLVGGGSTALHYGLALLLVYGAGLRVVTASTLGYAVSALVNYWLNARVTFRTRAGSRAAALRFAAMALMGWLLNYVLLSTLMAMGVPAAPAQILTTIGVIVWNYLVSALWTFRP